MTSSAPAWLTISAFSSELVTAMTCAFTLFTTWIWCSPSPPPAPVISTVCPGSTCATPSAARTLVPTGQTASAADFMSRPSGMRMALRAGAQVNSA